MKLFHILFGFDGQSWYFSRQRFPPQRQIEELFIVYSQRQHFPLFLSVDFFTNCNIPVWRHDAEPLNPNHSLISDSKTEGSGGAI